MQFRLTIRARLTLWYVALLAIILSIFSAFLYFSLARGLTNETQMVLETHSQQILAEIESENGVLSWREPEELVPAGTEFAVYDVEGRSLSSSASIPALPSNIKLPTRSATMTAFFREETNGQDWFKLLKPILENGSLLGWLLAVRSAAPVEAALHRLLLIFLLAIPLTLALAVSGGLFLARRALEPIDQITRTARAISRGDISQRLAWAGAFDEVGRLAATFDEMLDALEKGIQRQRQFTADASHELRTPLAVIKAETEESLRRPRKVQEYRQSLKGVQQQVDRMIRLVNDLLFLARSDAGKQELEREKVDLTELAACVVAEMQGLANQRGIELYGDIAGQMAVNGDQTRLTHLLVNLIENALTYTPAGGRVWVRGCKEENGVRLEVEDTGIGIPEEDLPRIFERFYRVDKARSRQKGGSGLGLAIAYQIVEAHGGRIEVESQAGKGSTFAVWLPGV